MLAMIVATTVRSIHDSFQVESSRFSPSTRPLRWFWTNLSDQGLKFRLALHRFESTSSVFSCAVFFASLR